MGKTQNNTKNTIDKMTQPLRKKTWKTKNKKETQMKTPNNKEEDKEDEGDTYEGTIEDRHINYEDKYEE